jgi:hypothetical protein
MGGSESVGFLNRRENSERWEGLYAPTGWESESEGEGESES